MSIKSMLKAIPLTTFNSSAVTNNYQAINVGGLPSACNIVRINNNSTMAITISYDGATDNEYLQANGVLEIQAQANGQPNTNACLFPQGTVVYIKGAAGTGTILLSGYYQPQGA